MSLVLRCTLAGDAGGRPAGAFPVMLLSVPYALKAEDAQTLGGLPASAFMLTVAA